MQIDAVARNDVHAPEGNLPCVVGAVFGFCGAAGVDATFTKSIVWKRELDRKDQGLLPARDKTERRRRRRLRALKKEQLGLCL